MYRAYLDQWGITYLQYLVLICLWEHDGQNISELSQALDLDSGTLSPVLKRMEKEEFVTRKHDRSDFRKIFFYLTNKAKKLENRAARMHEETTQLIGFDEKDMNDLQRIIGKIHPLS
ncbi:MarR family transcriptional regulator [Corynebacterium kutscheri]|uniref:Transcriptional regulator n=2 Tax=Corynebacterium kutscheri TaxID=35755 RepID=A0A0F6QYQ9_9CORY|nr:transcriptional regulator [Corynebacterium kutscheri]VEH05486.1 MarR family transcriptional regulator [Corynebacterium kutscheri]VEH10692.1 MarR family transcriptional regulator [Corynebacterium kutscheri]VEH81377.1 MarR family transcriptional regulator [Corynebacterium kutscheri]